MDISWNRGSEWHRWDPHLHTPTTALNNQFGGDWEGYLNAIEKCLPLVTALGITEYCTIDGYKQFVKHRENGRVKNIKFVFPNVEFRLDIQTERKRGINIHLLFSSDNPNHVKEIERVLHNFTFDYKGRSYRCSPEDLTDLGRSIDPEQSDDNGAFRFGVEQFKLDFKQLKTFFQQDQWMRQNCLIAVEVSEEDGTAGLQKDSAFRAIREEIEAFANIIFSSSESDRKFWLGKKQGSDRAFIERTYRSLKPCLHGSDAHRLEDVLKPFKERYCWIRSQPSFVGLKQTLLEPEARVYIGENSPSGPGKSECISTINVTKAPWLESTTIELNSGLVAIIGPKGSGKTALADIIATASGALIQDNASFLLKANEHLGKATVTMQWLDGSNTPNRLLADCTTLEHEPLVRYLSQQFVERLCSTEGMVGELLSEIEAVVFQSISDEKRLGATNFGELRATMLGQLHETQSSLLERIQELTDQIALEDEKKSKQPALLRKRSEYSARIRRAEKDLKAFLPKEKKKEVAQLSQLQKICDTKERELGALRLKQTKLEQLEETFTRLQDDWKRESENLKEKYQDCNITEADWKLFYPIVSPKVPLILREAKASVHNNIEKLLKKDSKKSKKPVAFSSWTLNELKKQCEKLRAKIGVAEERERTYAILQRKLSNMKLELERISNEIENVKQSTIRKEKAVKSRRHAYAQIFDLFSREQAVLEQLYAPLKIRLSSGQEATRRLDFHVQRNVDIDAWVARGEDLLDLRKQGPFQGKGRLAKVAKEKLVPSWKTGNAITVAAAMEKFLKENMKGLVESRANHVSFQDMGRWLFSTDHVTLTYGVLYDGIEISRLSPGMRGIVLLILYLAVDQWDMRPLIVDQPEENLDPQSVYDELVEYFRDAKRRRQVILVTHNPNLVVNADADQVIVAEAKREGAGLPRIRYTSGGLEDTNIRTAVCRILEGGERAFREREQRYAFPEDSRVSVLNTPVSDVRPILETIEENSDQREEGAGVA